ncbi:MAG TPA: right-handed parallel beta-helix repeat-containing protein, partial [Thermoanaerobaculia bacterium]|nr:right-handed parallel beta-helix repeat-containing protein [Thermoanaerobaculia bacterium]
NTTIRDNIGDPETVRKTIVGIIGITGREGADIVIERNRITRNSWDGIALYRGAQAVIRDNVIDGVDKARGDQVGGGRGVAIGMTWDARAVVERNLVTRYWKGIGAFVSARAEIRHNIVEDVITWGISLWDAGKGNAAAAIEGNAVYRAGACGASITREAPCEGDLCSAMNNAFVLTGLNAKYDPPDYYCRQEALAREAVPAGFQIAGNSFHLNREAEGKPGHEDVSREAFLTAVQPLVAELRQSPVLSRSRFLAEVDRLPENLAEVTPP